MAPPTAASPAPVGTTTRDTLEALGLFVIASVGMMLINKLAIIALPLPSTLMIIQLVATIGLLYASGKVRTGDNNKSKAKSIFDYIISFGGVLDPKIAKRWTPISALFSAMIFTSATSFLHASVSSILVFRNVTALISTAVDYVFRGSKVNTEVVLSEVVIVIGAALYGGSSATFTWAGLFWMLLNGAAQVGYGVILKREMDVNPDVKAMKKYTMSLYNNVMSLPLIIAIFLLQGEQAQVAAGLANVSGNGWIVIIVSCIFGFLISTSGFGLQQLVSATTFIVINNLAKFVNITLGMLFLNERISSPAEWCGCIVAFAGGLWYSVALQKFQDKQKKKPIK